ncbi:DNA polymerase epsilon subunit Dpb4 [Schizosaccharomyces cryophilus OY26]|uniref:DNA polymerase epsilon subunit D n=1 Tax=Schizosaccharomyces cryophilus (strain OY26 / ATCC MYA-4695 / CBS 11777 / NBRC 106824 / NRRL Y48691) TaxID=653667 RepID=S9X6A2_SCHCR|nr:DNA polymerase epsilon subunit Dpb4 [Schizosaccharomyces cryophilus OY26]EPY49306.1 DNA polymerase epsilon subunit Dpb4 [Schizosaccharomyces cryophilus OY26]
MDSTNTGEHTELDDLALPRSIVMRLIKQVLPQKSTAQKEAVKAITNSATLFISYLTSAAGEISSTNNRKIVMPQDVLGALEEIEYPEFANRLDAHLQAYEASLKEKKLKLPQVDEDKSTKKSKMDPRYKAVLNKDNETEEYDRDELEQEDVAEELAQEDVLSDREDMDMETAENPVEDLAEPNYIDTIHLTDATGNPIDEGSSDSDVNESESELHGSPNN